MEGVKPTRAMSDLPLKEAYKKRTWLRAIAFNSLCTLKSLSENM
jgi:hypothetical protein